ncbi:MAG: M56 family peptidase, partial [Sphingobacteriales bacterium]
MLQHLIYTSIIWLACLVVYEVLLRRESFHQANRLYLLASLVGGLFLPLADLGSVASMKQPAVTAPVYQV